LKVTNAVGGNASGNRTKTPAKGVEDFRGATSEDSEKTRTGVSIKDGVSLPRKVGTRPRRREVKGGTHYCFIRGVKTGRAGGERGFENAAGEVREEYCRRSAVSQKQRLFCP